CPVQVNYQQVQQVLVNLIINASHALTEHGKIQIHTTDWIDKENEHDESKGGLKGDVIGIVIQIKDKGQGIKKEDLQHIFDPFFTTKKGGTGLGLSVSYGIIRRHGGDIKVSSIPGEGTVFSVYLLRKANLSEDSELEAILDGLTSDQRINRRSIPRSQADAAQPS
ncbi:ATP-binding protein, partial [Neptunomonas sp.]|uniref:ATP-binding protein n=1 Tax=Neptunomonas sp. TaxID=1971898 RepID=UPI0035630095